MHCRSSLAAWLRKSGDLVEHATPLLICSSYQWDPEKRLQRLLSR